jgi:hypothetical protein
MFFNNCPYHDLFSLPQDGDWNTRYFVSKDSKGTILGLISYEINRSYDLAMNFGAINFSDNKFTFGMDLAQVIDDIFCKFNIRKLEFNVVVGNPVEKSYDKMIKKYGGNITGIRHQHAKLIDGKYYDDKSYEIFREEYIMAKEAIEQNKLRKRDVEDILNEK